MDLYFHCVVVVPLSLSSPVSDVINDASLVSLYACKAKPARSLPKKSKEKSNIPQQIFSLWCLFIVHRQNAYCLPVTTGFIIWLVELDRTVR